MIVALAIVTGLMLAASGIYFQQRAISRRLAAQRLAEAALENSYEMLRSGALPLTSGVLPDLWGPGTTLTLQVAPGEIPHTTRIDLVASYRVTGHPFRRFLQAILYTP